MTRICLVLPNVRVHQLALATDNK